MTRNFTRPTHLVVSLATLLSIVSAGCVSDDRAAGAQASLASMPSLGAAETFALLAGSTVTNTGMSMITGDVGVSPGSAIIGFPPGVLVSGAFHAADAPAAAAQSSLTTAYVDVAGQPCGTVLTGVDLGGMTLQPGVYCFSTSAQLTGTLTLDGMGDSNAVFVFQIGSTLTTASSSSVNMIGGAIPGRVFWQVGSSATLGTGTQFSGNILAMVSITATTGANLTGRALARTGAVTVDGVNGIAAPTVVIPPVVDMGMPDLGPADLGPSDLGPPDLGPSDLGVPDLGPSDLGVSDLGVEDGGQDGGQDAGQDGGTDAGQDGGQDAGQDLGPRDAGSIVPDAARGGLAGGALGGCSAAPGTPSGGIAALFAALGIFGILGLRRRRSVAALLATAVLMVPVFGQAQSVTLNQFQGAETPDDGLEVSRPIDLGHGRFAANLYLDYARNPLVYEATQGYSSTQRGALVRDQLAVRVGVALGLFDRVILFASGSGNLLMAGQERPGYVAADGTRMGDFNLGARVRLLGTPRLGEAAYGALAVQVAATLPMARWVASDTQLTGDGTVTVTPELLAEVGGRSLRLTANLGTRLRANQSFNTLSVGHELTWGLGLGVPVVGKTLEVDLEVYGATAISHPLEYATTPVEAMAGLRYRAESGWTAALGAGPGLARGYGSPDFRTMATVGWSQPASRPGVALEPEAVVVALAEPEPAAAPLDTDGDGVIDSLDRCPTVPGPAENDGCPFAVVVAATPVAPAEIVILQRVEFETDQSGTLAPRTVATLEEVRAIINDNPQILRVSIEGHADERGTDDYNQALSERRATAVMDWLVAHGVSAHRFESHGRGERDPFAPGFTGDAQQTNRNVQFFVLDPVATHADR